MNIGEFMGWLGLCLSTSGLLLQLYKQKKTNSVRDISTLGQLNGFVNSSAWLCYGLYLGAMPNIIISLFYICAVTYTLMQKYRNGYLFEF